MGGRTRYHAVFFYKAFRDPVSFFLMLDPLCGVPTHGDLENPEVPPGEAGFSAGGYSAKHRFSRQRSRVACGILGRIDSRGTLRNSLQVFLG